MTTPRDDIAGLTTWLNGLAAKGGKGVVNNIDARSLGRIANQLAALSEKAENYYVNLQNALAALENTHKRAIRAEQERDEAYERAAKVAENPGFIEAQDTDWDLGVNFAKGFIAAAIRRLASGPEKEGKNA